MSEIATTTYSLNGQLCNLAASSFAGGLVPASCYLGTLTSQSALPEERTEPPSNWGQGIDFDFRPIEPSQEANFNILGEHKRLDQITTP